MLDAILSEMQAKAGAVDPIGNSLKFNLGDSCIFIDGTGDKNVVTSEDKDADCTIKVSAEDLVALSKGELNPMMAMMSGKIKIDGDMGVAMKLQSILA